LRKKIIFIASLILLIILTLNLLFREGLFSDFLKNYLIAKLELGFHASVSIHNVRLNIFPPYLTAEEFTIRDKRTTLIPLLKADRLTISFSPLSLFSENLIIHKIQIQDPDIHVILEENGTTNFDFLTFLNAPGSAPPYVVQKLTLINGSFDLIQGLEKKHLIIPNFEIKAEANPGFTSIQMAISSKEVFLDWNKTQSVLLTSSEWKLETKQNHLEVKKIYLASKEGTMTIAGLVNLIPHGETYPFQFDTDVHLTSKKKGGPVSGISGHGKIVGAFSPDHRTSGNINFSQLVLERGRISRKIGQLNGHFSYRSRIFQIDTFESDLFGTQFTGSLSLDGNNNAINLDSEYTLRGLLLENLASFFNSRDNQFLDALSLNASGTLHMKNFDYKQIESSGHVQLTRKNAPKSVSTKNFTQNLVMSLTSGESDYLVNASNFDFRNFSFNTVHSRLQGNGSYRKDGSLHSLFSIETEKGEEIMAWLGYPQWTGTGEFKGEVGGTFASPTLRGEGRFKNVFFEKHPLGSGSTELTYTDHDLQFPDIEIIKDDAKYRGKGAIRWETPEKFQYHLSARADHGNPNDIISIFFDQLPLDTLGSGPVILTGNEKMLHLQGDIDLETGTLYNVAFDGGRVSFELTENDITFTNISLFRHASTLSGNGKITFVGAYQGEIRTEKLLLEDLSILSKHFPGVAGSFKGVIQGSGTFEHPVIRLNGNFPELEFYHQALKDGTIDLAVQDQHLRTDLRFREHPVQITGTTSLTKPFISTFEIQGDDFPIIPLLASTSGFQNTSLSGTLSGKVTVEGPLSMPQELNYTVFLNRIAADLAGYPVTNQGDLIFQLKNGALNIDSFHLKGEGTSLSVTGGFQLSSQINLFVTGEADLSLLKVFFKEITFGKGVAYLALNINNSWNDPRFQGGLTVQEGQLRTSFFSQPIHIASMGLFFNERQILLESFEAALGEGTVQVTGKIDLNRFKLGHFGIILETAESQFSFFPGWNSTLTGTLIYQGDLSGQTLQGEMTVSHGVYNKKFDLKPLLKKLTEIRENRKQPIPVIGNTRLNIHLLGEDDLRINNNLARLPFNADLTLKGSLDHPVLIGRMESESGTIQFYNKTFTVNSVSVDFIDPDDIKPLIDLKARTQIVGKERTYQIDLGLSGTLEEFSRTLTADDPTLTETDILSLILAGKKATEVATDPASQQQIGGSFVPFVIESPFEGLLKDLTGLERFTIEPVSPGTRTTSGPRVTIEEHLLNDKLILNYSYIANQTQDQNVQMDYLLNRHLYIQGIRNEEGFLGGNLKFRFEFR
jgi:hypothetical protein